MDEYDLRRAKGVIIEYKKMIEAIKHHNARLKILRAERKSMEATLFEYMTRLGINSIDGIKKSSIAPKPIITAADRRAKAVEYLEDQGYRNAEQLLDNIKATQSAKYILGGMQMPDASKPENPHIVYVDESDDEI